MPDHRTSSEEPCRRKLRQGSSHEGCSNLVIAGVDIVVTTSGEILVLEVNDHPGNLREPQSEDGTSPIVQALANELSVRSGTSPCVIVLPDAFRLTPPGPSRIPVSVAPKDRFVGDFQRAESSLGDLSALLIAMRQRGVDALICDKPAVESFLTERHGSRTIVFDRLPGVSSREGVEIVNAPGCRRLCGDKRATTNLLSMATVPCVPCVRPEEVLQADSGSGYVVTKPRVGAAGYGVIRHAAGRLAGNDVSDEVILQPWMDLLTTLDRGRAYRFDLRVVVIGGKTRAIVARRAGAPTDLRDRESSLTWLTTTGRRVPIWINGSETAEASSYLSSESLTQVRHLAELAVKEIDTQISLAGEGSDFTPDYGFARHNGVNSPLERIQAIPGEVNL